MKVENRIHVLAGAVQEREDAKELAERKSGGGKTGDCTIFAGNMQGDFALQTRIQQRKEQAQRQAMKVVSDAWDGERKIDDEIDTRKEHIKELQQDKKEEGADQLQIDKQIIEENAIIRGIREEKRKTHPMVEAQETADDIIEASQDDVINMVMQDAKTHLDEEQEKREEEAEKIEEEREEQEELLEERKEEEEELEDLIKDMPVDKAAELENVTAEVKRQINNMLSEMGLAVEDIKGSQVDMQI